MIRAILKPRKRKVVDPNNCLEADRIEIEYFKEKVACIKEAVEEELDNPVKKNQPKSYIDLAGQQIQKLLAAARKKKKERLRATQVDASNKDPENKAERRNSSISMNSDAEDLSDHNDDDEMGRNSSTVIFQAEDVNVDRNSHQPQSLGVVFKDISNLNILFQRMGMYNEEMEEPPTNYNGSY